MSEYITIGGENNMSQHAESLVNAYFHATVQCCNISHEKPMDVAKFQEALDARHRAWYAIDQYVLAIERMAGVR